MNFNRNKNTTNASDFVGSSRSFIDKFYSSFNNNEPPLSPVSKVSFPDIEKTANNNDTSNFSLIDNSPNPTQESEIKTNLIKKFEDFLENLRTDELITNEDEIFNRFIQINSTKNHNRSKTPDTTCFINRNVVNSENLMRQYENLMIVNNELDLELINANMQIREKNNKKVKGLLEIQRKINCLQEENEKLMDSRDSKKGSLFDMIKELKGKEENEVKFQRELNEILISKEIVIKTTEKKEDNNEKLTEIEKKKAVLREIQEKNGKILEEIREIEKNTQKKLDLEEIQMEILRKNEKIEGLEKLMVKIEREMIENKEKNEEEMKGLKLEILNLETEEKNDEKHKTVKEKYEDPIEMIQMKKTKKKEENEETMKKFEKIIREISSGVKNQEEIRERNQNKKREISQISQRKTAEILAKVENMKEILKNNENSKDFLNNELKRLEISQQGFNEDKKTTLNSYSERKNELNDYSISLKATLESENQRKNALKNQSENMKMTFFGEKVDFLKDLRKKVALMKDVRNQISEEISSFQLKSKEIQKELDVEKKSNMENSMKCEEFNKEISQIKENIGKCSRENEEICGKFKLQIEENCGKEKEIKEIMEINEKWKVLTETQLNEINNFNEKNNLYFKEIQILEKKNLKEWNNYLKEKEKAAKKKKK